MFLTDDETTIVGKVLCEYLQKNTERDVFDSLRETPTTFIEGLTEKEARIIAENIYSTLANVVNKIRIEKDYNYECNNN